MFNLRYSEKCEVQGELIFKKPPWTLGNHKDIDGRVWNIWGVIGDIVQACPVDCLHPHYKDTSGSSYYGLIQQSWKPYKWSLKG